MKQNYDKRNTNHNIQIGTQVMLWWPYYKRGIPRSLQPSWKGPFTVVDLIGNTNCKIEDECGRIKCVHLNQLKVVAVRNTYSSHRRYIPRPDPSEEQYVSFDEISGGEVDDGAAHAEAVQDVDEPIVNHGWCNIDEANILPNRTRNWGRGGNVGTM